MIAGQTSRSRALMASAKAEHQLYYCYDADDRLLYVGCSMNARKRVAQHQHAKAGDQLASRVLAACMTRVEFGERYPTRDAGRDAEASEIFNKSPLLNFNASGIPGWMVNEHVALYVESMGMHITDVGLWRCLYCNILMPYRAPGYICIDCTDADFRAYVDERDAERRAAA